MKKILTIVALLISGCANQPLQPKGEFKWENDILYSELEAGKVTPEQIKHKFVIAKNTCRIDALKVPIPSPSCTQPPRQDCTGQTGFALGFCQGYTPGPECDYSSVKAAKAAQEEIFESCMSLSGWIKIWVPFLQPV